MKSISRKAVMSTFEYGEKQSLAHPVCMLPCERLLVDIGNKFSDVDNFVVIAGEVAG